MTETPLRRLVVLFALPARIIHETLHLLPALPWAEQIRLDMLPREGHASMRIKWSESAPETAILVSALAPLLAGLLALCWAVWLVAVGGLSVPADPTEAALLAIAAAYVVLVMDPSVSDSDAVWGGGDE